MLSLHSYFMNGIISCSPSRKRSMQGCNSIYRNSKFLKPGWRIKYPEFMAVQGNPLAGAKTLS